MQGNRPGQGAPAVLLAGSGEWFLRSLESILSNAGYLTRRAFTGRSAYDDAHREPPDAIIVAELPDVDALDLCRRLRGDARIVASTPILLAHSGFASRPLAIQALRAGASDLVSQPIDAEEFVLRLESHLRGKRDADWVRNEAYVDPTTGLYTARGLEHRLTEVAAHAARAREPLACVVLAWEPDPGRNGENAARLADDLRAASRRSDTLARPEATEVVVLAPSTGESGAAVLADRLVHAAAGATGHTPRAGVRVIATWPRGARELGPAVLADARNAVRATRRNA